MQGLNRRGFAAVLAASGVAAAAPPQPPPRRSAPPPEVPPFQAPLEFTRKDVPARVHPFPMTQVKLLPGLFADAAEWNRGYMRASARRSPALQFPRQCRPARRLRPAVRRLGGEGRRQARDRVARPFHGPLPFRQRPVVRLGRRQGGQGQGRRDGRRAGQVPAETAAAVISAPSPPSCSTASTRCLNSPGRPSTPSTKSWPACSTCTPSPATSTR